MDIEAVLNIGDLGEDVRKTIQAARHYEDDGTDGAREIGSKHDWAPSGRDLRPLQPKPYVVHVPSALVVIAPHQFAGARYHDRARLADSLAAFVESAAEDIDAKVFEGKSWVRKSVIRNSISLPPNAPPDTKDAVRQLMGVYTYAQRLRIDTEFFGLLARFFMGRVTVPAWILEMIVFEDGLDGEPVYRSISAYCLRANGTPVELDDSWYVDDIKGLSRAAFGGATSDDDSVAAYQAGMRERVRATIDAVLAYHDVANMSQDLQSASAAPASPEIATV